MTSTQMHQLFDIIQDKYNAPYFIQDEKDMLLNTAQTNLVNNLVFKDYLGRADVPKGPQALYDVEDKIYSAELLRPIIVLDEAETPSSGKIAISGLTGFLHLLGIRRTSDDLPVRYMRQNNIGKFSQNTFKAPSSDKLYYSLGATDIYIYPSSTTDAMKVSYIKEPNTIAYGSTDSNLPSSTHPRIVAYAIELAGIALYDEAMATISQVS